jgi:hypothetical protein
METTRGKLKQALGNWVTGDRFWDREEDIRLFIERVEAGANQLLVAQRRMGKTSLMRETARRLEQKYLCLYVDLQKAFSPSDAVVEVSLALHPFKSLWTKVREVFANIRERVEKVGISELAVTLRAGVTAGDWPNKADRLMAILAAAEKPVLLLLDEVPVMVNRLLKGDDYRITPERRAEADQFMSWLRAASIQHQGKVRIVVSGSIGFEPILRQAQLSATLNTFVPFELKPWEESVAIACLNALGAEYGVQFDAGVPEEMVRRLGCCVPHHVQMFFDHAYVTCRRRGRMEFSSADVGQVYEHEMLSIRGHAELAHYEGRLKVVLGEALFPLAMDMLTEAAVVGHLSDDACRALQREYVFPNQNVVEAQKEILGVLEHDGYLAPGSDGYAFVSKLLRDWWKARNGFGFTPVLERGI